MIPRAAVVAQARTWLGTPWQHQQRTKGVAVDCAGLVIGVARELGLVPADMDIEGYARSPDGTLLAHCDRWMTRIDRTSMQPGDVLVIGMGSQPQHLGFLGDYVHGGLSLIHAASRTAGMGCVLEHRLMFARNLKFMAAYALPGVV